MQTFNSTDFQMRYAYKSLQPQWTPNKTCTAMYVSIIQESPHWFSIPCNETIKYHDLDFICESPTEASYVNLSAGTNSSLRTNIFTIKSLYSIGCPESWWLQNNTCIKTIISSQSVRNETYVRNCQMFGGKPLTLFTRENHTSTLLFFMNAILEHSNVNISFMFSWRTNVLPFILVPRHF